MFTVEIDSKVAWVTGASRGIGKEIALSLAKAGSDIAVSYKRNEEKAAAVVNEIVNAGGRAKAFACDVAVRESVNEAYRGIVSAFGRVDILVNNAGTISDNLFVMLDDTDWRRVLDTNLMGSVYTTHAVARDMMMNRWGRIINITSVAATKGGRGQANYAASKGAVEAMTRSLATELASRGITVNCIAPGVIETDMSAEVRRLGDKEIMARQLIKRYGDPAEVAAWAVFVASDYAGFITGQTFHIDGGLKMA